MFDVITPAGHVYRFPPPTLFQRLLALLCRHADVAAMSAVILALLYFAGLTAEAVDMLAFSACEERKS